MPTAIAPLLAWFVASHIAMQISPHSACLETLNGLITLDLGFAATSYIDSATEQTLIKVGYHAKRLWGHIHDAIVVASRAAIRGSVATEERHIRAAALNVDSNTDTGTGIENDDRLVAENLLHRVVAAGVVAVRITWAVQLGPSAMIIAALAITTGSTRIRTTLPKSWAAAEPASDAVITCYHGYLLPTCYRPVPVVYESLPVLDTVQSHRFWPGSFDKVSWDNEMVVANMQPASPWQPPEA